MVAFQLILNRIAQGRNALNLDHFAPDEAHLQVTAADLAITTHAHDNGALPGFYLAQRNNVAHDHPMTIY
jgi:hypothetical protein